MTKMCQCPAPRKAGPVSEATGPHLSRLLIAGLAVMAGVGLLWAHLPALRDLWTIWLRSDEYSSGLLVPPLAAYLIWSRRLELASCPIRPVGWGIFAVLAAEAFGVFGFLFMFGSAMRLSFVLAVIACFFTLFGWPIFRKVWPVLLFLFLMLPLPNRVEGVITMPLQGWSTASAVFGLETLGYEAVREGNVIHIGETSVAVAEACNGLRMVTGFIVICALVVLLVKRPAWQKVVLLASALPIALACNTVRLILTSLAFTLTSNPSWRDALHDYGGYAMMPLALASVWGELYLMHLLVVAPNDAPEQQKEDILVVGRCAQNCQAE